MTNTDTGLPELIEGYRWRVGWVEDRGKSYWSDTRPRSIYATYVAVGVFGKRTERFLFWTWEVDEEIVSVPLYKKAFSYPEPSKRAGGGYLDGKYVLYAADIDPEQITAAANYLAARSVYEDDRKRLATKGHEFIGFYPPLSLSLSLSLPLDTAEPTR